MSTVFQLNLIFNQFQLLAISTVSLPSLTYCQFQLQVSHQVLLLLQAPHPHQVPLLLQLLLKGNHVSYLLDPTNAPTCLLVGKALNCQSL